MLAPGTAPRETVEGGRVDRARPPRGRDRRPAVRPGRRARATRAPQGARGSRLAAIRLRC